MGKATYPDVRTNLNLCKLSEHNRLTRMKVSVFSAIKLQEPYVELPGPSWIYNSEDVADALGSQTNAAGLARIGKL
jgi:hypothetical protein